MKLLLDIGNTRIKWGVAQNDATLLRSGAVEQDEQALKQQLQVLSEEYSWDRVVVVCVASETLYRAVSAQLQQISGLEPQRFQTQAKQSGVANHYREASQLGADRWAAMIAAHTLYSGPLLVCSCGTAVTFDLLKADGQHLGGYIQPGLSLSRQALNRNTAQLPLATGGEVLPADETVAAIANGTVLQIVASIEYLLQENEQPDCVLTGGDALWLGRFLNQPFHHDPDLVLKGLAMAG